MAEQKQLVCQHLENISREILMKYKDIIREYVRRRHGVYALYNKNRLYYVGLATNLRSRLSHQLRGLMTIIMSEFFSFYGKVGRLSICMGQGEVYKGMGQSGSKTESYRFT